MNYNKIGEFISNERKAKKLSQAKLAEKLFVSEKTISKWETGRGIPDTNSLPKLCEIFGCTLNDLLNGERISLDEYNKKAEEQLLKYQAEKERLNKVLLKVEIVLGIISSLMLLAPCFVGAYLIDFGYVPEWLGTIITFSGFIPGFIGLCFTLKIEQVAGYYECKECGHKRVPTYKETFVAHHIGRTRRLKCETCKKRTWHKKVIK